MIMKKQIKTKIVKPYYYHKIYYAFKCGEFMASVEAGSYTEAIKELNKGGYTSKKYDCLLECDKKCDSYLLINLANKKIRKSATSWACDSAYGLSTWFWRTGKTVKVDTAL